MVNHMKVSDILKLKGLDAWQKLALKVANPNTIVEVSIEANGTVEIGNEVK